MILEGKNVQLNNLDNDGNLYTACLFGNNFKVQLVSNEWFDFVTWTGRVDDSYYLRAFILLQYFEFGGQLRLIVQDDSLGVGVFNVHLALFK